MSRLMLIASWFCTCLGMTFLLLVPLVAPDSVFADAGSDCAKAWCGPCGQGQNCPLSSNNSCYINGVTACCNGDTTCCAVACGSDTNCYDTCAAQNPKCPGTGCKNGCENCDSTNGACGPQAKCRCDNTTFDKNCSNVVCTCFFSQAGGPCFCQQK